MHTHTHTDSCNKIHEIQTIQLQMMSYERQLSPLTNSMDHTNQFKPWHQETT